jgi:aromatic-L-amino-acid decarboxylase
LIQTLSILPDYLRNQATESDAVFDYRDWHVQLLGRRFRALKLWFVIRHYVRRHVELAETFARRVGASAEFGLAAPAPLNLVCFRHKAGDEFNRHLLDRLNRSGTLYLIHTMLQGRHTLQLCVGQTWTEARHVEAAWRRIQEAAAELAVRTQP